jgi:hypothetical protein
VETANLNSNICLLILVGVRLAFSKMNSPDALEGVLLKMFLFFFLKTQTKLCLDNYFLGHFSGYFEGDSTFLTPKLSLALFMLPR